MDYTRLANETVKDWTERVNGQPNLYKVHCDHVKINGHKCNKQLLKNEGLAVVMPWAGIRPRYYCAECAEEILSYHGNARRTDRNGIGTPKKGSLESTTIGCELEYVSMFHNRYADLTVKAIIERNFNVIAESDSTVDFELPTDYMFGCNIVSKNVRKLEKYELIPCFDNSRCGAHIHVGITDINTIRNWYNTLFVPLCEYIDSHNAEWLVEKFGRNWAGWATKIDSRSDCYTHSNFVNCQHNKTLEFRLPRIKNANQYLNCIYFWRKVGWYLNNTEWLANNGHNRAERKAQAQAVANAIVEIAREYFGA